MSKISSSKKHMGELRSRLPEPDLYVLYWGCTWKDSQGQLQLGRSCTRAKLTSIAWRSFRNSPSDAEFGHLLADSNCLTSPELPPLAAAEALQDNVSHWYKIRRVHLIVDTPNGSNNAARRTGSSQMPQVCLWVCPWSLKISLLSALALSCARGVLAHLSCPLTLTFVPWGSITSMIYEAFSIEGKANLRQDARAQFGLQEAELTSDLRLTAAAVLRMQWGQHKEQPKAPPARTARRDRVPRGVISPEQGEATLILSTRAMNRMNCFRMLLVLLSMKTEHGLMLAAYREVGSDFSVDNGNLWRGWRPWSALSQYRRWPLAGLTVPLLKSVEYLDRVLAGCCWEVLISRKDPDDSIGALRQAAKSLTLTLASYLADFVAGTLRASRTPQGGPLTDEENIHLLGGNFWVQPIFQELLHAASGHNVSVATEKGSGRVVGLWKLWPSQGVPRLEFRLWTQRALLIG